MILEQVMEKGCARDGAEVTADVVVILRSEYGYIMPKEDQADRTEMKPYLEELKRRRV